VTNAPDSGRLPFLPAPEFTEQQLQRAKDTGDYSSILFEWYKFVGSLANFVTHIERASPAFRFMPPRTYYVLVGLLNRCSRLMLSNVALSHEGKFGETTSIVDRCIFESALKLTYLSQRPDDENIVRFLADGLKPELELLKHINENIAQRGGNTLPIEARMLTSIRNHFAAARLTEAEIASAKSFPNVASLVESIGYDRLHYVVAQRIGSHHVHGTWTSLLAHYLERHSEHGEHHYRPRGHDCATHINQFMFVSSTVLRALIAYVRYAFVAESDALEFSALFESTEKEIMRVYTEAVGGSLMN
jgi:hypothetical protein